MRQLEMIGSQELKGRRVLKAAEVRQIEKAGDIIARTRAEMDARTAAHADTLQRACADGRAEAYAAGCQDVLAQVEKLQILQRDVEQILRYRFEAALSQLLRDIPRPGMFATAIAGVIEDVVGCTSLSVTTHPAHVEALQLALAPLIAEHTPTLSITFEADPDMTEDCGLVFAQREVFDISFEVIVATLVDHLRSQEAAA